MAKIEFVDYTGCYPNLCRGVLTVLIDGKEYKFGHESEDFDWKTCKYKDNNLSQFWYSGGSVRRDEDWNMWAEEGSWQLDEDSHEDYGEEIKALFPDLIKIFNDNVPQGCCGGCI